MKVDLVYPKIPYDTQAPIKKCYAFEKLDGTNMHWFWNLSDGWHCFGTRRTQFPLHREGIAEFTKEHPELANAPQVFNDKFRDRLSNFFARTHTWCHQKVSVFTEFYGPNSFAGAHDANDAFNNTQTLTIIDVALNNQFFGPEQLVQDVAESGGFDVAKVVYSGKYTGQLSEDVRKGKYDVKEGVVIKAIVNDTLFMTKVKTDEYVRKLKKR